MTRRPGVRGCLAFLLVASSVALPAQSAPASLLVKDAARELHRMVDERQVLGMVVRVQRGDEVLLHEAWGHRDSVRTLSMQKDTLFRMASNTKAVTAAAVLTLVEEGKVGLDDAIAKWFPTFDSEWGRKVTVRQLLTHSSGLRIPTLFVQPLMTRSDEHPDAPNLVLECMRFGEVGPAVEPGTTYSYNNPGYNLCAGLVEKVTGENFADYCKRRFYEPLGMRDTCHHESVADDDRMAMVVRPAKDGEGEWQVVWAPGGEATVPFVRGSGGLISTAADFGRFARVFVEGGGAGEVRVLAAASVAAATRDQIPQIDGVRYGFGWSIGEDGTFWHSGSDGTFAWCDPEAKVVGMVLTQMQGCPGLGVARQAFRKAVTEAMRR